MIMVCPESAGSTQGRSYHYFWQKYQFLCKNIFFGEGLTYHIGPPNDYHCIQIIEVPCAQCTPCKASELVTFLVTLWDWTYDFGAVGLPLYQCAVKSSLKVWLKRPIIILKIKFLNYRSYRIISCQAASVWIRPTDNSRACLVRWRLRHWSNHHGSFRSGLSNF